MVIEESPKCKALTKLGKKCKNKIFMGTQFCGMKSHQLYKIPENYGKKPFIEHDDDLKINTKPLLFKNKSIDSPTKKPKFNRFQKWWLRNVTKRGHKIERNN